MNNEQIANHLLYRIYDLTSCILCIISHVSCIIPSIMYIYLVSCICTLPCIPVSYAINKARIDPLFHSHTY